MNVLWIALDVAMVALLLKASGLTWFTGIQVAELAECFWCFHAPTMETWIRILMVHTVLEVASIVCTGKYFFARMLMYAHTILICIAFSGDLDFSTAIQSQCYNVAETVNRGIVFALIFASLLTILRRKYARKEKACTQTKAGSPAAYLSTTAAPAA